MNEMNEFENLNSNKNTDEIINKIQNSLNRLQSAINNKQIADNLNKKNETNTKNINLNNRQTRIDNYKNIRKNKPSIKDENMSNMSNNNNFSMGTKNSVLKTDKRTTQKKLNQNMILNNLYIDDNFDRKYENIIPNSTQARNTYYNKISYNNYARNSRNNNNLLMKKKCIKCGNINPPRSRFCFNCGLPLNNITKNSINNINQDNITQTKIISHLGEHMLRNIDSINDMPINQSQIQMKPTYNNLTTPKNSNRDIINLKNNKIMNNIFQDLNDIQNEELINYKKLNDLYLYGDYLEKELKVSNDENVKLLEKFKVMKIQVHSLNQKNNKLKQNIEILSKKEKEISKINDELKNGFDFVQNNLGNNENNEEKMNILNELELNNKKHIEMQTEYEKEIENLKKKISLLVDNDDEENDEDEKMIKVLEDKINKDKKELEDKNVEYMLLIKKNEKLNQEIKDLVQALDLDFDENEEENLEEEEKEEKEEESNDINDKKDLLENEKLVNNDSKQQNENLEEKNIINKDNINKEVNKIETGNKDENDRGVSEKLNESGNEKNSNEIEKNSIDNSNNKKNNNIRDEEDKNENKEEDLDNNENNG